MKTIIYSLAVVTLLLTFASCNVEDVLENNNNQVTTLNTTTDIDPPMPMPKPM
ncbi:hypothetical protein [Flavobacterium sp.]|jgi:hypothetical protein|uniref:hypothetical protein n=1 Tax=Flavobacterium sp. TaxID=239 RepID=UPI0038FC6A4A